MGRIGNITGKVVGTFRKIHSRVRGVNVYIPISLDFQDFRLALCNTTANSMKAINILTFLLLLTIVSCQKKQDDPELGETINLPLTFVEGFGTFPASAGFLGYKNPQDTVVVCSVEHYELKYQAVFNGLRC